MARYYNGNKKAKDGYSGMEGRKRMEREGSSMIYEDPNAMANLPQEMVMKYYPSTDYFRYNLNDDLKGIDVQIDDDVKKEQSKVGKQYPEKY